MSSGTSATSTDANVSGLVNYEDKFNHLTENLQNDLQQISSIYTSMNGDLIQVNKADGASQKMNPT